MSPTPPRGHSPAETATARLARLLTMVPWLANRQGIDVAEAARGLGVSERQLEADLELLFMCGYGQMPDELIDAQFEDGRVFVTNAETIARPLRLGMDEALTLIVGLRALAAVPGLGDREALDRALAKLAEATGTSAEDLGRVEIAIDDSVAEEHLAAVREALRDHRRLHLSYLVPGRDESTERDVDPMRLVNQDARWYLEGWCHRAEDTRLFRMDRVESVSVLPVDGTPPQQASPRDLDAGTFQPGPGDLTVTLRLDPRARWVADYYPVETVHDSADGTRTITLRTADTAWLRRLVLRLGGLAEVVSPTSLAAEVTGAAEAALTAYDQGR